VFGCGWAGTRGEGCLGSVGPSWAGWYGGCSEVYDRGMDEAWEEKGSCCCECVKEAEIGEAYGFGFGPLLSAS